MHSQAMVFALDRPARAKSLDGTRLASINAVSGRTTPRPTGSTQAVIWLSVFRVRAGGERGTRPVAKLHRVTGECVNEIGFTSATPFLAVAVARTLARPFRR